jgi:hypothetical protein
MSKNEETTYELTESGKAVYYAFIEAYMKKHPEASEEQAVKAIRESLE